MLTSNQNKPEYDMTYNPHAALEFFKLAGRVETVKSGHKFFVQGQKAGILSFLQTDKTYLLVDGKVAIQTAFSGIIEMESGELFGEFTPYTILNATVTASGPCKVMSINENQLVAGFKKKPEFLFMLMDVLAGHLPKTNSSGAPLLTEQKHTRKNYVLNSKMLNELKQKLGEAALTSVPEKRVVFQKGAAASLMYVILEGNMTISINDKIVGRSGVGNVVGEIALAAPEHARTASVVAETRCLLLAITRQSLFSLIPVMPTFGISLLRVLASHLRVA